jgi:hypothetical protein
MSDSSALRRIVVMKHCSQLGQDWPRQTSERASSLWKIGQVVDFGAVACFGGALPAEDGVELRDFVEAGEQRRVAQGVELLPADVVGPALHVADLERAEQGFEEGDVLEVELLLEVFGAGGDDDALLLLARAADGGEQVGQGLAGAGAGFDDEVAAVGEALLDLAGHGVLPGAVLEGERGLGEDAAGVEEVVEAGKLRVGGRVFERREWGGGGHR